MCRFFFELPVVKWNNEHVLILKTHAITYTYEEK